jgi:hypothetical protein
MEIEQLTVDAVLKEVGVPPSIQELSLVPKDQQSLFIELRRNNNLLQWLIIHTVYLNNLAREHDKQLSPLKMLGKMFIGGMGLIGGIEGVKLIIYALNGHKP